MSKDVGDTVEQRTADEWLALPEYAEIKVLDPDGWDRADLMNSWAERISREEFDRRLTMSTCAYPKDYFIR